jgi:hypothetical protein
MTKCVGRVGAAFLVAIGGCVTLGDDALPAVSSNPFNTGAQPFSETTTAASQHPAADAAMKRVAVMGQRIVAMNPDITLRPRFIAIGVPEPEVFHVGAADLYVTEGLVTRCTTDGQLAAVLCQELGKMVTEREILTTPAVRSNHREPPPELPVGRDSGGLWGGGDPTRYVEMAQHERQRPRKDDVPPPDPQILARGYIQKTGYTLDDLDAAAPLLREAEAKGTYYKKMMANPAARPPAQ